MKVLVLVARGLRPGALGCYGNLWVETPALDALAAAGVVFDAHFADRADPEGARAAWRTGRYGLPTPGADPGAGGGADLLDCLRARGVETRLVVDAGRPAPAAFESGWSRVERIAPEEDGAPTREAVLEAVAEGLGQLAGRDDWLLWVDL